jgi:DNA (cytosine-5)-methyltransferase 1
MPTAIDLLAGLGGWSTAARKAGIDVISATNHSPDALEWHNHAHCQQHDTAVGRAAKRC